MLYPSTEKDTGVLKKNIPVTKPFLPPKEEYLEYLSKIWDRNWLTNNGPNVKDLEKKLEKHLDIQNLLFLTNGTIAIQIAIKALELKGEVITTPFSYVATTSSLVWENCTPVFVDIDPGTFNVNPELIEKAITKNTTAILATHVFGNPCDVEAIQDIANRNGLKVIYDAAHCFGVNYKGMSLLEYGDISTLSFHATKLFHTVEGGAVVTANKELQAKMLYLRNFGHDGPERFANLGVNGKNSEFHAAMGLCNLKYIDDIKAKRKEQYQTYLELLQDSNLKFQQIRNETDYNFSYFPVVFESENILFKVIEKLGEMGIKPRRYFYPSLAKLPYVEKNYDLPVADKTSKSVLCLPLYHKLELEDIELICRIIKQNT